MPGALPVPNRVAIELLVKAGLAFGSEIPVHFKVRSQELLLSGHAQGLPDLAVRRAADAGRRRLVRDGGWRARVVPAHAHPPRGRYRKIHARVARRPHRGLHSFARGLQPRGRAADGMRLRAGHSQRRAGRRIPRDAQAHVRRARRQRREDGGRLAALRRQPLAATGRRDRVRHEDRDQEHEFVSVRRARDGERDRAADRDPTRRRPRRAGDAWLG